MNPLKAIGFKLISALLFAGMSALVRQLGDVAPVGQMVFSTFPIFCNLCSGELLASHPFGDRHAHSAFRLEPLCGAGVASVAAIGSAFALTSAICNAGTVIQTRRLTQNETTSSIVFYFSLICAIVGVADVAIRVAFSDFVRADRADCTRISRRSRAYFSYRELSLCGCIGRGALRLIVDVMGIAAWLLAIRRIARKTGLSGRGHCHRRRAFRDLARAPARSATRSRGGRPAAIHLSSISLSWALASIFGASFQARQIAGRRHSHIGGVFVPR